MVLGVNLVSDKTEREKRARVGPIDRVSVESDAYLLEWSAGILPNH